MRCGTTISIGLVIIKWL
jgi:hypothetical protein